MSIVTEFVQFAADEGDKTALDRLERIQDKLEDLNECGSLDERKHVASLMATVNLAITEILGMAHVKCAEELPPR